MALDTRRGLVGAMAALAVGALISCGGSVASGNPPGTTGVGNTTTGGTGAATSSAVTTSGGTGGTAGATSAGSTASGVTTSGTTTSGTTTSGITTSGITTGGITGGATTGSAACNALVNDASWVVTAPDPGVAPPPTGGVIATGRYVETSATAYTNGGTCQPTTTRSRWVGEVTALSAASGSIVETFTVDGLGDGTGNVTYQAAGTAITNTVTCFASTWGQAGGTTVQNYTATPNEIRTFGNSGTCTSVSVLTRVP